MLDVIDHTTLDRWRADPVAFVERCCAIPRLASRSSCSTPSAQFLAHAFKTDDGGRLLYPRAMFGAPKKSGKTGFAALHMLTTMLLFGGRFAEGYALANDLEQAQSRVFRPSSASSRASPLLRREAKITADKITFPAFFDATISAVACDYAALPVPTRRSVALTNCGATPASARTDFGTRWCRRRRGKIACRLTVTYAGFQRRERAARRTVQARHGAAADRSRPLRRRWSADGVAPRADRAVAGRALAG